MKLKRLWWTFRLYTIRSGAGRADYARKKNIYAHIGKNVSIQSRTVPLYSELISFHDNIAIARNVDFCTHDIMHAVFNRLPKDKRNDYQFKERIGCIEIMDNVFVGSNSVILYDTKIGPNVVIASGSVITKDCEPNSVYAGVPARKIGTFEELIQKRINMEEEGTIPTTTHNQALISSEIKEAWNLFYLNKSLDS